MADSQPMGEGPRILVVDDNDDNRYTLTLYLDLEGYSNVEIAHDGAGALEAARAQAPQIVFLDIGLPGMDGYEVARRLRSDVGLAGSKLIAPTLAWPPPPYRSQIVARLCFSSPFTHGFEPTEIFVRKLDGLTETV